VYVCNRDLRVFHNMVSEPAMAEATSRRVERS
jgi:hypothetical protein